MRRFDTGVIYEIDKLRRAAAIVPAVRRPVWTLVLPWLFYLALSLIFFARPGDWTGRYLGYGADPLLFVWFLKWWPFAISHGLNPFVSNAVWFPQPDNLAWDSSVPSAALLALPVTLLGGPVLAFDILTLLAPALCAGAAFLLCLELTGDTAAAAVGGYLFGFSSYECAQLLAHLNLSLVCLVPLALWLCLRRLRGKIGRGRFIPALAGLLLVQLGLSTEILASFCLLGAMVWAVFWVGVPARRQDILDLGFEASCAALAMAILAAPFVYYLVIGLGDIPAQFHPPAYFAADPVNYLVPTMATRLGRLAFAGVSARFTGNVFEQGAYLGLPLIVLLVLYFRGKLQQPYARALLVSLLLLALLSLGPVLHLAGPATGLKLPWWLATQLPVIGSLLPARFTMYVSLAAAAAVSLWLRDGQGRARLPRFAAAALACVFLLPNPAAYGWKPWPAQPFFTPANVAKALGPNANVIILPFGATGPGMAWQMQADDAFTQTGGYLGYTPRQQAAAPVTQQLMSGRPRPGFDNSFTLYCLRHRVTHILLAPGTPGPLIAAVAALGWPHRPDHGIAVFTVPSADKLNYLALAGDYFALPSGRTWMGHQLRITTNNRPATVTISGQNRPAGAPVQIDVTGATGRQIFMIGPTTTQTVQLPATGATIFTADSTFAAATANDPDDAHDLSVQLSITPAH